MKRFRDCSEFRQAQQLFEDLLAQEGEIDDEHYFDSDTVEHDEHRSPVNHATPAATNAEEHTPATDEQPAEASSQENEDIQDRQGDQTVDDEAHHPPDAVNDRQPEAKSDDEIEVSFESDEGEEGAHATPDTAADEESRAAHMHDEPEEAPHDEGAGNNDGTGNDETGNDGTGNNDKEQAPNADSTDETPSRKDVHW